MSGPHQRNLDSLANDAAGALTREIAEALEAGAPFSSITAAIRELIKAEIAAATYGMVRAEIKDW